MDITEIFGPVIHSYTRAQAIADGALVDITATATEGGIAFPVAMTASLHADCVTWTAEDEASKGETGQSEKARLWDVVWMTLNAIRRSRAGTTEVIVTMYRVPRTGDSLDAEEIRFKAVCGPGDRSEPVITLMGLDED